jgi:hypothetical protein
MIHSWSPDSRWILHEACGFYCQQDRVVYSTWAASVDGEVNRLTYGPFNQHPVLGWLSPELLLTYSRRSIGSSDELRTVDLLNGNTDFIFNQAFLEAAYDQADGTILLNQQPVDYANVDSLPGIYSLEVEGGEMEMLMPGRYSGLSWQPSLGYFVAVRDENELIGFDADGELICTIEFQPGEQISYSPDGEWIVIGGQQATQVFAPDCNLIFQIDLPGEMVWLPDAAGALFFHLIGPARADIYRYLIENNWETELYAESVPYLSTPTIVAP